MPRVIIPIERRFWAKVQKTESCWLWTGAKGPGGYGQIGGEVGSQPRVKRAHRVSYELHYGPIGEGLVVCHRCDNPSCVRPDHLVAATQDENVADMVRKSRLPRGEQRWTSKLQPTDVVAIRREYRRNVAGHGIGSLAKRFAISPMTVIDIIRRQTWAHVQE